MSKDKNLVAILMAILAAALYAISTPVSKVMLQTVAPTMVAAFLYLGAGSVVVKDIPSDSMAVGNPCRVIRKINTN